MSEHNTVLITGASSGIGATYADRFARRGHDLVLVARNRERLEGVADRLRKETGVSIDIVRADLIETDDLAVIEARLREDAKIGILTMPDSAFQAASFSSRRAMLPD